jgi:hypothetical protein
LFLSQPEGSLSSSFSTARHSDGLHRTTTEGKGTPASGWAVKRNGSTSPGPASPRRAGNLDEPDFVVDALNEVDLRRLRVVLFVSLGKLLRDFGYCFRRHVMEARVKLEASPAASDP